MHKILTIENHTFSMVNDPVRTEQNAHTLMLQNIHRIPKGFNYIAFPIADYINKHGVQSTQTMLDRIEKQFPFKKVFVCQHIHVQHLNFYENTVFTPHTLKGQRHIVIPHYNALIQKSDFKDVKERKFMFSFFGAFNSHPTRKALEVFNGEWTPIADTGSWHYYKSPDEQARFKKEYVGNLCDTKYNVCPEGTGVSTIRLYEAMACGSVPVLLNDVKVPDCIERYCIRTTIGDLRGDIMRSYDAIEGKCKEIHDIYWKHLENDQMFEYILSNV